MRSSIQLLGLALGFLVACGGSGDTGNAGSTGSGGASATSGTQSTAAGNDATTSTGSSAGGASSGAGGGADDGKSGTFAYGMNAGYYNQDLLDVVEGQLGTMAGVDSERAKLTEPFLNQWGDAIHVPVMMQLQSMGMKDIVCLTIGMAPEHSNAPAGGNTENYSPKGLYEPIFLASGDVNPANYWAAFMQRVVKTYSPYIHQWEIWNEPDQVGGNWQATQTWTTTPPKPADLVWWNDSIFAYIRLLRISHEIVKKLDPGQGKVTLGGIGYDSFLDAILRYTDEPMSGAVDAAHPSKGADYFDEVSFHYYPVFTSGNSDAGAKGMLTSLASYHAVFAKYGVTEKPYIVTESGAPRYALGTYPGGVPYAPNYLMKVMSLADDAGIRRIDWFILGDGADPGASQDSFQYMGLYQNLTNVHDPKNAVLTESGIAYATLGHLLKDSLSDPAATKALGLKAGTNGVALTTADMKRAYVVWAEAADENGKGSVSLPLGGDGKVYHWDYSKTQAADTVSPAAGNVVVNVTSEPVIVIGPK